MRETREVNITPEMAKDYLKHNRVNRTWNRARSVQYAEDMKAGRWELNAETIKFYEDGSLADGRHRLEAIIIANVPVRIDVTTGVANNVSVQDRGRNRSVADVMQLKGHSRIIANSKVVAMAKLHYAVQKNITNVSDGMVEDFIVKNCEILEKLSGIHKDGTRGASKGVNVDAAVIKLPCFYAMNSGEVSESQIRSFLKVVKTGIPEALNQSAAIVCRNDLLSGAIPTHANTDGRKRAVFQIEKAIQDFAAGYPRKKTYAKCAEPIYSCHTNNKED